MDISEQWLPVVNYEGRYEVSDLGRVKSLRGVASDKVLSECHIKGYAVVTLYSGGTGKTEYVHRLVLEAFVGPPPQGKPLALHWDDNPQNNALSNLRWGSYSDNAKDSIRNGHHFESSQVRCKNNHEFTEENTRIVRGGKRQCRVCARERDRIRYAKNHPPCAARNTLPTGPSIRFG